MKKYKCMYDGYNAWQESVTMVLYWVTFAWTLFKLASGSYEAVSFIAQISLNEIHFQVFLLDQGSILFIFLIVNKFLLFINWIF